MIIIFAYSCRRCANLTFWQSRASEYLIVKSDPGGRPGGSKPSTTAPNNQRPLSLRINNFTGKMLNVNKRINCSTFFFTILEIFSVLLQFFPPPLPIGAHWLPQNKQFILDIFSVLLQFSPSLTLKFDVGFIHDDYASSLVFELLDHLIPRLQRVQNSAARILTYSSTAVICFQTISPSPCGS